MSKPRPIIRKVTARSNASNTSLVGKSDSASDTLNKMGGICGERRIACGAFPGKLRWLPACTDGPKRGNLFRQIHEVQKKQPGYLGFRLSDTCLKHDKPNSLLKKVSGTFKACEKPQILRTRFQTPFSTGC
jgi:hypothetical protein